MSPRPDSVPAVGQRFPLWIVVIVSIVLTGTGASTVRASCGDYLHHSAHYPAAQHAMAMPLPSMVMARNDLGVPERPCSGPECRRTPVAPASHLPIDVRSVGVERLALLAGAFSIDSSGVSMVRSGNPLILLEDHRAGLDRPPRSA